MIQNCTHHQHKCTHKKQIIFRSLKKLYIIEYVGIGEYNNVTCDLLLCSCVEGKEVDKEKKNGIEKKRLLVSQFIPSQERASTVCCP